MVCSPFDPDLKNTQIAMIYLKNFEPFHCSQVPFSKRQVVWGISGPPQGVLRGEKDELELMQFNTEPI